MKRINLVSCQFPKYVYERANTEHIVSGNYMNRKIDVQKPNQIWCGDVTNIWADNHWRDFMLLEVGA